MKTIPCLALAFAALLGSVQMAAADQPNMHEALVHLREAREALMHANAGKEGHRVKAIEYIDKAISECHVGVDDSRNDRRPAH